MDSACRPDYPPSYKPTDAYLPPTVHHTAQADKFVLALSGKAYSLEIGLVLFTEKFDTAIILKSIAHLLAKKAAVAEVR